MNLAYSSRNRSASVRIPITGPNPKTRRIEVRFPDPSCNPYLAFAAMMMAGLDGMQNKINPGDPLDKDIYALSPEELKDVPHMPGSLDEALATLERDHEFLLRGDVFTKDAIHEWLEFKREQGAEPDPHAADAVRVLPLLRHLILSGPSAASPRSRVEAGRGARRSGGRARAGAHRGAAAPARRRPW